MNFERNLQPWERVVSIAAGAGLIVWGSRHRAFRGLVTPLGVGLIARGGSAYCPVSDALGRGRAAGDTRSALRGQSGINVCESITVQASPSAVYNLWKQPETLTQVMPSLERVDDLGHGRSHWVVSGPAGYTVEWDAETINDIPGKLIAWRSLPGADVATAGSVRFEQDGEFGTCVTVRLQYNPPAGKAGAAFAKVMGDSPAANIQEGLRHLKSLFESGDLSTVAARPDSRRGAFNAPHWADA